MNKRYLTQGECCAAAYRMAQNILQIRPLCGKSFLLIYGIPRGGVPVAYLVKDALSSLGVNGVIAERPGSGLDCFVDDIIDSGATRGRYMSKYPGTPFLDLAAFIQDKVSKQWLVFPWESQENGTETSADDIVIRLLERTGEDPGRCGLRETPKRFLKAWDEWTSGYKQSPSSILKTFEDGAQDYDEMVVVRNIPFYSLCEHHLAPFFGTVCIGYIPQKKIVGLSKLPRLVEVFARRLQVQERLTTQIAGTLMKELNPLGVAVYVQARHLCMESRGIQKQGHQTETSAMLGVFRTKPEARAEFLTMVRS